MLKRAGASCKGQEGTLKGSVSLFGVRFLSQLCSGVLKVHSGQGWAFRTVYEEDASPMLERSLSRMHHSLFEMLHVKSDRDVVGLAHKRELFLLKLPRSCSPALTQKGSAEGKSSATSSRVQRVHARESRIHRFSAMLRKN